MVETIPKRVVYGIVLPAKNVRFFAGKICVQSPGKNTEKYQRPFLWKSIMAIENRPFGLMGFQFSPPFSYLVWDFPWDFPPSDGNHCQRLRLFLWGGGETCTMLYYLVAFLGGWLYYVIVIVILLYFLVGDY